MTRFILVFFVYSCCSVASTKLKNIATGNGIIVDAYESLAKFLKRNSKGLGMKNVDNIKKVLEKIATGQATLKSMDGLSHQFINTFKDSSSLTSRYEKFLEGDRKSSKEANKIYEYIITVERSLQAAEILQTAFLKEKIKRCQYWEYAGLEEILEYEVTDSKLRCIMYVLRPLPKVPCSNNNDTTASLNTNGSKGVPNFHPNELVIAIIDDSSLPNVLRVLDSDPLSVSLSSGLVEEEVYVQPTLLAMALKCLIAIKDIVLPLVPVQENTADSIDNYSNNDSKSNSSQSAQAQNQRPVLWTASGQPVPSKIRIVGHSAGGGVAALMTVILDASLNITSTPSSLPASAPVPLALSDIKPFIGSYNKGKVKCVCLGPPPCLSRAIIPRSVTSVLCGDDILPRVSPESLELLRDRVVKGVKAEEMRKRSPIGWFPPVTDWMNDAIAVAGKGVQQYATGSHDLNRLSVPGRVFFMKPRKLKEGASLQRVLRGNWREDTLWLLHDILLSDRMIDHHSLEAYIRTLARC